jgi:hypothetical protein
VMECWKAPILHRSTTPLRPLRREPAPGFNHARQSLKVEG